MLWRPTYGVGIKEIIKLKIKIPLNPPLRKGDKTGSPL